MATALEEHQAEIIKNQEERIKELEDLIKRIADGDIQIDRVSDE